MFCPKCGCIVKDDAGVCPECGHRIRREERKGVSGMEQPVKGCRSEGMSRRAIGRDATLVVQLVLCMLLALTVLLPWADGMSAIETLGSDVDFGSADKVMRIIPVMVLALGLVGAGLSLCGRAMRNYLFPVSIVCLGAVVLYGVSAQGSGFDIGAGVYAVVVFAGLLLILQLRNNLRRKLGLGLGPRQKWDRMEARTPRAEG